MTKADLDFIEFVKAECKKHKIKFSNRKVKYLRIGKGIRCGGYFDSEERILAVAGLNKNSLGILVHEYAHMTQWLDKIDLWDKSGLSLFYVDEWLNGKEIADIEKHMKRCRDLELDNEKRSVKLIKKYNIGLDIERYIKCANSYVYFYTYMLQSRKWCKPTNSPYNNEKLIEIMPSKFVRNYDKLPKKIEKMFIEQDI